MQEELSTTRQSQVAEQLSHMEKNTATLHAVINFLEERLEPVLRKEPSKEAEGLKDRNEIAPLAFTLEGLGDSVKSAVRKLEDILTRLEL